MALPIRYAPTAEEHKTGRLSDLGHPYDLPVEPIFPWEGPPSNHIAHRFTSSECANPAVLGVCARTRRKVVKFLLAFLFLRERAKAAVRPFDVI